MSVGDMCVGDCRHGRGCRVRMGLQVFFINLVIQIHKQDNVMVFILHAPTLYLAEKEYLQIFVVIPLSYSNTHAFVCFIDLPI